jgi:protein tyrosine phosphatase (PTP) superfamily phosphohydrolase (DUF442 family)
MSVQSVANYLNISERISSSGQPEELQFKDIATAGHEVVINLAMPNSENALPDEGYIVSTRKMAYVHIPVPFDNPTIEHLKMFFGVMVAFSNKKCWIHCVVNKRVSAFMFQYQKLILGASSEEANKVVIPNWQPNKVWQEIMELKAEDVWL